MHSKLRIAFIVGDFATGGGQIACFRLASAMARFHEVFLVNARPEVASTFRSCDWPSLQVIDTNEVESHQLPSFLANRFRALQIDLMHSHIWWADRLALQIKDEFDLPWVTTLHGCQEFLFTSPSSDPQFYRWARKFYQKVNGIAYLSDKNLIGLRHFGIPPFVAVRQIYNCAPSIPVRQPLSGEQAHTIRFILASRAIPEKGWDTAIEALALIDQIKPGGAHLTLVGDGPSLDAEKSRAEKLNVSHAVTFAGHVGDPTALMQECHIGILPSRFTSESLPNSIVEYLQCGLAVIGSPVGEIPHMVRKGPAPAGLITPPYAGAQSAHELAACMRLYQENQHILDIHSNNSLLRYQSLFSEVKAAREYNSLYASALQAHYNNSPPTETLPRFAQDVDNIEKLDTGILSFMDGDAYVRLENLNRVAEEHVPGGGSYPPNEFAVFEREAGVVRLYAHPSGSVDAILGPYTSYGSTNDILKVSLKLHVSAMLENQTYSARIRLKIVNSGIIAHAPTVPYKEVVLSDQKTVEARLEINQPSSWKLVCSFEIDKPSLAPYLTLLITGLSVTTKTPH